MLQIPVNTTLHLENLQVLINKARKKNTDRRGQNRVNLSKRDSSRSNEHSNSKQNSSSFTDFKRPKPLGPKENFQTTRPTNTASLWRHLSQSNKAKY